MSADGMQRAADGDSLANGWKTQRQEILDDGVDLHVGENNLLSRDSAEFQEITSQRLHAARGAGDFLYDGPSIGRQGIGKIFQQNLTVAGDAPGGSSQIVGDSIGKSFEFGDRV